ncbi:MAG: T9SS type A sorting domain-containing protein, partial [Candidatus Latescibacterota bacterium]
NDYADYIFGDATDAYTTHSPMNNYNFPLPGSDWSWGYAGANPVDHAYRTVLVVRDPATPPYFIIIDDIDKDGSSHMYEWRLHTGRNNNIDTTANPIHLTKDGSFMDIHVLNPPFSSLQKTITYFNNRVPDPDSNILALSTTAVNPMFTLLLLPGDATVIPPTVSSTDEPWGRVITVAWNGGETDVLLINQSGSPITYAYETPAASPGVSRKPTSGDRKPSSTATVSFEMDASLALVRLDGTNLERYLLTKVSTFIADGVDYVTIGNGTATVGYSGTTIDIDRFDADFSLFAPGITDVFYRKQRIHVVENGGYLTRDPVAGTHGDMTAPRPFRVHAYPNPFNPSTTVVIDLEQPTNVAAAIFDAKGRLIKRLWSGPLSAGLRKLRWEGRNEVGQTVASGVYLLMVTTGRQTETLKLTVIR